MAVAMRDFKKCFCAPTTLRKVDNPIDLAKAIPLAQTALDIYEQIENPNIERVRKWLKDRTGETGR